MLTFAGISSRRTVGNALVACIAAAAPLTAQDRSLTADFPEVYRAGGLNAPDWAQFAGRGPVSFDATGNLHILDSGNYRVVVIDSGPTAWSPTGKSTSWMCRPLW